MKKKSKNLLLKSIVFDAVGMVTMFIPVVGPFLDIAWAPYAAKKMTEMYPGKKGKIASFIVFVEEILPWTDFVPTFTLMWIYTYVLSSQKTAQTIEVDVK